MKLSSRAELRLFLALTFALSWAVMFWIIARGGMKNAGPWVFVAMWVPGLVSLLLRAACGLGFRDVGWRAGAFRWHLLAAGVPLLVAFLAKMLEWGLGVSEFQSLPPEVLARHNVSSAFALILRIYPLIFAVGCVAALGEELGWRGYLVPRLLHTPSGLVQSSLIWGVWHFPLILWGGYASSSLPVISALLFLVMILASGVFVGWLRIQSGSVWVAMVYHAAHNLFLQTAFEIFNKPGPRAEILGGESGVLPCVTYLVVLGVLWRFRASRFARTA